jgi:diguanylate cyclase (GGDEF)-like protein
MSLLPFRRRAGSPQAGRFRLVRFFAIASLGGIAVVTLALVAIYRAQVEENLIRHENRANAHLTHLFSGLTWARYRPLVAGGTQRNRDELIAAPQMRELRAEVVAAMTELDVAKVKIYDLDGLTVFSTDEKQIGERKADNLGFVAARAGQVSSQITHRDRFDAFEGVINNRSLIATYIPARASADAPVEGVFEVYSDVTAMLQQQRDAQWRIGGIVVGLLALLYVFLSAIVKRAERTIELQVREREEREARVRHEAFHDPLTGLPNRAYFHERIAESIALTTRTGHPGALMFIDLDRFKFVNDTLGHEAGDQLLRQAAARIGSTLRDNDVLFRMGGDEFTIILPWITAPEDAAVIAKRIQNMLGRPVQIDGHELSVGASIGIAIFPDDGADAETLVRHADAAMYSAKAQGRGTHAFYQASMNARALERMRLEAELKRGFQQGEFELLYQPRLDAVTRRPVAIEALLRWNSPTRGQLLPEQFLRVLEESGQIALVGEWVLRQACTQLGQWLREGAPALRMSVNIASAQLRRDSFVESVGRVLQQTGVPPALLEVEIIESMLVADGDAMRRIVNSLKQLGVRIAIDDFGAGQSSLQLLRVLDVDFLKVDRSVIADVAAGGRDQVIANALVDIARALGIAVVAEGVETAAQARACRRLQCTELQGNHFADPVPAAAVPALITRLLEQAQRQEPGARSIAAALPAAAT